MRCKNLGNGAIFEPAEGRNWGRKNSVAIRREFSRGVAIRIAAREKSGLFAGVQTGFHRRWTGEFFQRNGAKKTGTQKLEHGSPLVEHLSRPRKVGERPNARIFNAKAQGAKKTGSRELEHGSPLMEYGFRQERPEKGRTRR